MVIPYREPGGDGEDPEPKERKVLTRRVKVDCIPGVSTNAKCQECAAAAARLL